MNSIVFIDTEIDPKSQNIIDIGGIKDNGNSLHSSSISEFIPFIKGSKFICGHNILNHDIKYIHNAVIDAGIDFNNVIDTLYLSPLLFPTRPYHALVKDDKLQSDELNNPLNDSIKAKDLFYDEVATFHHQDDTIKIIFYLLLHRKREFKSFFNFINYKSEELNLENLILEKFHGEICEHSNLTTFIKENPTELAYCLSLINCQNRYSITPRWVIKNYPATERIMLALRAKPCLTGCVYCNQALNIHEGLKFFFGFDSYRTYADEPLH